MSAIVALCALVLLAGSARAQPFSTQQVLAQQSALGDALALRDAPWIGTHNSYNSRAEMGAALSALDANQGLPIVAQLELGVRNIELDVHWFPSLSAGGRAPVVCHARGPNHLGCTIEKSLRTVLREIDGWLRGHPREVLLLYLEDHLDGATGSTAAARAVDDVLGTRVYRPADAGATDGSCAPLPLALTRRAIRAAGRQVLIVGGCGAGLPWRSAVFGRGALVEARPLGFADYPRCGREFDRATYDRTIVRYFEDRTLLTRLGGTGARRRDPITPTTAARMARCGVDLIDLDMLARGDARLDALVWSWAPSEPAAAGRCAVQRAGDGRWHAGPCGLRRRPACLRGRAGWIVARGAVPAPDTRRACERARARRAVPRTGEQVQLLRAAMRRARVASAWIAFQRGAGGWRAVN